MICLTSLPHKCPLVAIAVGSTFCAMLTITPTVLASDSNTPLASRFIGASSKVIAQTPSPLASEYTPPADPSRPRKGTTIGGGPRLQYNPPGGGTRPRSGGTGGGTRGGCSERSKGSLTILAPFLSHTGRTTSTHPTFAWFMPYEKSYNTQFRLYEYNDSRRGEMVFQTERRFAQGIKQITLPPDQPALVPGKQYVWQVVVICEQGSPSKNQVIEAVLQVDPLPTDLKGALATTKDPFQRATLYAEAGFWYDALATVLNAPEPSQAAQVSLLEQLLQLEAAPGEIANQRQGDRLKQVIEFTNNPG